MTLTFTYLKESISEATAQIVQANLTEIGVTVTLDGMEQAVYYDQVAVMQAGKVVELGAAGEVLQNPKADYTRMLLQSWPRSKSRFG